MRNQSSARIGSPLVWRILLAGVATVAVAPSAQAQITGTVSKPLPNVLLLVDTSGSMERMPDNSLPSASLSSTCSPGNASVPNRWGMLVQALTGNLQPFFSCDTVPRTKNSAFDYEFRIGGKSPGDVDYYLPWHRMVTGSSSANACTIAPFALPGGTGVGPANRSSGVLSEAFPDDSFMQALNTGLKAQLASNAAYTPAANECLFGQASDGQLDTVRDFIRVGLMTFDSDIGAGIGVAANAPPGGGVLPLTPFDGEWSYIATGGAKAGRPAGCLTDQLFEVGARHRAAPPWEGRMVPFASAGATLFDIEKTNDQVQQVLLGTRPYGATPIDGMMDDAADYLTVNTGLGPYASGDPNGRDLYVQGGCRDQYIILLTDGAPNLDMRPDCGLPTGVCPFKTAGQTAKALYGNSAAGGKHVATFVIGFSVNGSGDFPPNDGFPAAFVTSIAPAKPNCKAWYNDNTNGGKKNPVDMYAACTAANPPKGSTAAACCQLNEIAYFGSGGDVTPSDARGPFFAESQADLSLAFGSVLAQVARTATTRTVPGSSPVTTLASGSSPITGNYVASFIPNAQKVWSGEIDRTRYTCDGSNNSVPAAQSVTNGDSYAYNTAAQATAGKRLFITVQDDPVTRSGKTFIDSAGSVRPFVTGADGIARVDGAYQSPASEFGGLDMALAAKTNWDLALGIDGSTCKRSKGYNPITKATIDVPALTSTQCKDVIWGFATATNTPLSKTNNGITYEFNTRCPTGASGGNVSVGTCSFSGATCDVATACADSREVCVPNCSALGAVFRSSPTVVGPPYGLSSDEGFRGFQQDRAKRRPALFVSTADGVLHAFKALPDVPVETGPTSNHELWAFIPPAILPKLAPNYPAGSQILLDGTPTVRDTVWDRVPSSTSSKQAWHTTLVSGLGVNGGGYYGVNVTDVDCGGRDNPDSCLLASTGYQPPTKNAAAEVATGGDATNPAFAKRGPHFLWQVTDSPAAAVGEQARTVRTTIDGTKMVSLFGKQAAIPAIATLNILDSANVEHQVGVAILPGGIDGPPLSGECQRAVKGSYGSFGSSDLSDTSFAVRNMVRKWAPNCTGTDSSVNGRGVTIVRLDNGQVIRHFGRKNQDVPTSMKNLTIDSPFDSPIIGTPVVYPASLDTSAQKIFVADADGTVWRLDVSAKDSASWRAELFTDLANNTAGGGASTSSQPVQIPMSLATSPNGNLVLNVATGDQENIIASTSLKNWLYSIEELRPSATLVRGQAAVRWYKTFAAAERVTGPMVVFDRTLYFATYKPEDSSNASVACGSSSATRLWGMDYVASSGTAGEGGLGRWCDGSASDPSKLSASGACKVSLVQFENVDAGTTPVVPKGSIIPGVSLKATQSCATYGAIPDGPGTGYTSVTPVEYKLFFGVTAPRSGGGGLNSSQAERKDPKIAMPRISTSIDAWSLVID